MSNCNQILKIYPKIKVCNGNKYTKIYFKVRKLTLIKIFVNKETNFCLILLIYQVIRSIS